MAGPIGFRTAFLTFRISNAAPKLMYKIETSVATEMMNSLSINRSSRMTMNNRFSDRSGFCPGRAISTHTFALPMKTAPASKDPLHALLTISPSEISFDTRKISESLTK